MSDAHGAREKVTQLGEAVRARWDAQQSKRSEKLEKVEREGVFAAAGMESALRRTRHMTRSEGRSVVFEETIGSDDTDHVFFLGRGIRASRPVCRLVLDGQAIGTGFLVAPRLLLTNNHVLSTVAEARTFLAEFDYELGIDEQMRAPIVRFALDPDRAFVTSDADTALDFTFVAVRPTSTDGAESIDTFGWLPMDIQQDKILEGEPAVIIQHPRGEPKRLCLFSAKLVDRFDDFIHYTTDTDHGSSGSPVFNRGWQLIGLHHAATTSDDTDRGHRIVVNEGIRVSSILKELQAENGVRDDRRAVFAAITAPAVIANGRPQGPVASVIHAPATPGLVRERTTIRRRPAEWFVERDPAHQGYRPEFLGIDVPLPQVDPTGEDDVAITVDGSMELTYTHFSVVQSISRRLPLITAVNIDGDLLRDLAREDRQFEAADTWYYDPRLPENAQLGPELYDGTAFDFGHMVRRGDPVWGAVVNTARMANDDTFYMTNAAPQHQDLNRKTWLRLEDAMLASARLNRVRISVFTGPILSAHDPVIREVHVPTAFWKIVAYVGDDGVLCAHGFVQRQTALVDDVRRNERLRELQPAAQDQVPIRDIATESGLDFGPLVAADLALTGAVDQEGRLVRREAIDDSVVLSLFMGIGGRVAPQIARLRRGEILGVTGTRVLLGGVHEAAEARDGPLADH